SDLQKMLILLEERELVVVERVAAEPMRRKAIQDAPMPPKRTAFEPTQDTELILFVRDPEASLEQYAGAQLAEQLRAERVDRASLDARSGVAELGLEPVRDLAGGFVRERECADARWIKAMSLDEESDPLGEAERLARARAGEHQQRTRVRLDRKALRRR